MLQAALLIVFLTMATATDVRFRKVYNWTTYPGILLAVILSVLATWFRLDAGQASPTQAWWIGIVDWRESLLGFLACGSMMLFCYIFFAGRIGGGDVKLIAMVGAFLGAMSGLEAMLWTFILGGCFALISLVWRYGAWNLLRRSSRFLMHKLRLGAAFQLTDAERQPLRTELFLSPSALLATLVVLCLR